MPRDLGDVLHYFLPEVDEGEIDDAAADESQHEDLTRTRIVPSVPPCTPRTSSRGRPAALPIAVVPVGDRDVVRSAFTWNLAVEVSRLGGRAVVLAPALGEASALWPDVGVGPIGTEIVESPATDAGALYRHALDLAVERAPLADGGGVVFVRVPPTWLVGSPANGSLRWVWLLTSSERRDLLETYGIAKRVTTANPGVLVGVTVHGVRSVGDARAAFERLENTARRHLARTLTSYGLLVDDLHVYRAIVAGRPIGLAHPQSPAARSLREVARMILDDAQELAVV